MKCLRSISVLILLGAAPHMWAAAGHPKTAPNIFESFHLLDAQFTRLDTQFQDLQHAVADDAPHARMARDWQHAAREMRATTVEIRRLSDRWPYRGRRTLGHRMFGRLHSRARTLQARLLMLSRVRSRKLARREEVTVAKAMLDLVLQYQALSGGYAAATCHAGAWSCGVPKKEPRKVGYPAVGVKWTCVERLASCHGILGPRSPILTESPLTANTQAH